MTRKRPVSMLVIGIINLVLGPLGLAGSCCCGFAAFGLYAAVSAAYQEMKPEQKAEMQDLDDLWSIFAEHMPGIGAFIVASLVSSLVMYLIQTISGIGLVLVRSWGRWLCALWAFLAIISTLAILAYWIAVVTPGAHKSVDAMESWMQKMEEKQRQMGKQPAARQNFRELGASGNPVADNFMLIVVDSAYIIYAAVAFIIMILPSTGQAIARYHGTTDGYQQGGQDDGYDEDYLRRRRDLGEPPPGPGPPDM